MPEYEVRYQMPDGKRKKQYILAPDATSASSQIPKNCEHIKTTRLEDDIFRHGNRK